MSFSPLSSVPELKVPRGLHHLLPARFGHAPALQCAHHGAAVLLSEDTCASNDACLRRQRHKPHRGLFPACVRPERMLRMLQRDMRTVQICRPAGTFNADPDIAATSSERPVTQASPHSATLASLSGREVCVVMSTISITSYTLYLKP